MEFRIGRVRCVSTSNHAHDYRLLDAAGNSLRVNSPANDHSEQREIAAFIADAFNVHHETGRSARQLRDQRDVLLGALIEVRDGAKDDHPAMWNRVDAAIAAAGGESGRG